MESRLIKPTLPCIIFVPALEDRFWRKLLSIGGQLGGCVIDLEDSIHISAKQRARENVLGHLDTIREIRDKYPNIRIVLRVNNERTEFFKGDIDLLNNLQNADNKYIDAIMYPKPESPDEIRRLSNYLDTTKMFIVVAIETLNGYRCYSEILRPEQGVRWCLVGAEDLSADMNIDRPTNFYDNPLLTRIATDISLHAKLEGLWFYGNIWPYLQANELLSSFRMECLMDQMMGALGKFAFHPYQINTINNILNPFTRLDMQGRTLIGRLSAIKHRAQREGLSVAVHDNRMIDMPEFVRLKRWLQTIPYDDTRMKLSVQLDELEALFQDSN